MKPVNNLPPAEVKKTTILTAINNTGSTEGNLLPSDGTNKAQIILDSSTYPLIDSSKAINSVFSTQQTLKSKEKVLELLKEIAKKRKSLITQEYREASSKTGELFKKCDDFVRCFPELFASFDLLPGDMTPVVRCFRERQGKDIDISLLDEKDKKDFFAIQECADDVNKLWEKAEGSTKKVRQEVKAFFEQIKEQYPDAVDSLRLEPPIERKNVKVLAAISQLSAAISLTPKERESGETMSLHGRNFSRELKTTTSMDEAINQVCNGVYVYGENKVESHIQKAVCSKNNNPNAWKKAENTSLKVKRFVISVVAGEGSQHFRKEQEGILSNYVEQSAVDYNAELVRDESKYRVDKIIKVFAPTKEEEGRGITWKEKVENAFKEAKLFVEQQRKENSDLEFEGIAHWHGHGTCLTDKICPGDEIIYHDEKGKPLGLNINFEDDISYQEGSLEFLFITRHLYDGGLEGIDKTVIKRIEQENLKGCRYFVHDFHSCCSGAMIA